MTRRLTRLATGLTGAAVTLLLLVGPPWLLTTLVGPPVPTSWPDLDTLRAIATVGVTDTFVITTLAVIVWIAWAQLALAIVIELAAAIRRRPAISIPLVPGTRPLAARLVAATLLLVTVLQPRPIATAAPFDVPVATAPVDVLDEQPAAGSGSTAATRTAVLTPTRTIEVGERDSWWSLAETHLGEGIRWRELRDLNSGRVQSDGITIRPGTDQLQPGWTLLVPATDSDDRAAPVSETPTDQADDTSPVMDTQWEVEHGDHFWYIAKTTLEHTWDRTPDDHEIAPYWQQLIDTNRDQLAPPGDPDLIYPGQEFELSPVPADPQAPETAPVEQPDATIADPTLPELDAAEAAEAEDALTQDAPGSDDTGVGLPETMAPIDGWHGALRSSPTPTRTEAAADATVQDAAAEVDPEVDSARNGWSVPVGLAPGIAATMFAAAGAAALISRRRREALQQRPATFRLPTLAPDEAAATARLAAAAPPDEVLADLVDLLCSVPPETEPVLVLAHEDGTVSLLFDHEPAGSPPAPWSRDDGNAGEPVRWTARLGDRGRQRSFGMPLLVTLGQLDDATLLANLGAMRALTIDGEPAEVRTRIRAITLELATSRTAGPVEVTVAGDNALAGLDQVRHVDDPASEIAAAAAEVEQEVILDDRVPRLIVAHDGIPAPAIPEELAPLCAIVATGGPVDFWRFSVDGDHGRLHLPDGTAEQVVLPDLDPDLVASMVASVAAEPVLEQLDEVEDDEDDDVAIDLADQPVPDQPVPDQPAPDQPAPDQHPAGEPQPWCEVGLLGPFTVIADGEELGDFTSLSREVLAYLVTHRENATTGRLEDCVWAGRAAPGGHQRVRSALARLRRQLGPGPDSQPLLPSRHAGNERIELSPSVGTDLDRAHQHLRQARRLTSLDRATELLEALRLVRGEPFEDLPVSWAVDIQEHAIAQLQDAAVEAAAILRDEQRFDEAEEAIRRGLLLCDPFEMLYVEWARLEQARSRPDRIRQIWRRLQQRYADEADEVLGVVGSPTLEVQLEFTRLSEIALGGGPETRLLP